MVPVYPGGTRDGTGKVEAEDGEMLNTVKVAYSTHSGTRDYSFTMEVDRTLEPGWHFSPGTNYGWKASV